ncbi:LOW QUALITY PROTEIN: thymidine kinase, cytosolic [Electrophorus electricus]|uniref:LOW QUALITY PROTEIN: thymidine kinase, cytosolic n=1 Tax=Electrophorus electricus TaxID=8005 RepID=UPI0015CF8333|nr:LOW QUALITY PROTEIN: thymidine kinase, cytosolic [Electrophorus electricus]
MDCLNIPMILPNSPRKIRGQIQVIFGPMFSGKSTELMRRVRRFQIAQYCCLVIKYAKDTRYSDKGMSTHDRNTMDAVPATCLRDVRPVALEACVIGIDEGQFFPDIVEFSEEMANLGKTVIVAALDGTFQRKPFGSILNLVPLAESVVKLNAVCMQCFKEAAYTKRLGTEKEVEVIGGADKYHAVCRACYRACYGGLLPDKENSAPHTMTGKQVDHYAPRRLLTSLHI